MKELYPEIVKNSELLSSRFGNWPSFHDCEVVEMRLDRELGFDFKGPKLDIKFYIYEISLLPEISQVNGTKAIFRFYRTDGIDLEGFNHQNQFNDLLVESYFSERLKSDRFRIQFAGFGANVSFSCSDIEILSVEPYTPTDYFKKDSNTEPGA